MVEKVGNEAGAHAEIPVEERRKEMAIDVKRFIVWKFLKIEEN